MMKYPISAKEEVEIPTIERFLDSLFLKLLGLLSSNPTSEKIIPKTEVSKLRDKNLRNILLKRVLFRGMQRQMISKIRPSEPAHRPIIERIKEERVLTELVGTDVSLFISWLLLGVTLGLILAPH
jgi:hypothetical protein